MRILSFLVLESFKIRKHATVNYYKAQQMCLLEETMNAVMPVASLLAVGSESTSTLNGDTHSGGGIDFINNNPYSRPIPNILVRDYFLIKSFFFLCLPSSLVPLLITCFPSFLKGGGLPKRRSRAPSTF